MTTRLAALLLTAALALSACGGSDTKDAATSTTTTRPTTTSSITTSSTTPEPTATPHALANIATQVDDQLRRHVVDAAPCIHGPAEECNGQALNAYQTIDDLAGAVNIIAQSVTKGTSFYAGQLPRQLSALYTETMDAGAEAKAASEQAQLVCLPAPGTGCADANSALDDALVALYKLFNQWRALL